MTSLMLKSAIDKYLKERIEHEINGPKIRGEMKMGPDTMTNMAINQANHMVREVPLIKGALGGINAGLEKYAEVGNLVKGELPKEFHEVWDHHYYGDKFNKVNQVSQFLSNIPLNVGQMAGSLLYKFASKTIGKALGLYSEPGPKYFSITIPKIASNYHISKVYGTAKVYGSVLWFSNITQHRRDNRYTASFAIAICEGQITEVKSIYANEVRMHKGNFRIYLGTEEQEPDPEIIKHLGRDNATAYRGLAYIVFYDFDITELKTLPVFSFEVNNSERCNSGLEKRIESIVMLPGSGEFVYDTVVNKKLYGETVTLDNCSTEFIEDGREELINSNHTKGIADSIVSLNNMAKTLPNLRWVSVVVNWFATSLDISEAQIKPAVEFKDFSTVVSPKEWTVAGFSRATAPLVGKNEEGEPLFGGTVNDASLLRYLQVLKSRGYKVLLYPMPLVNKKEKPWRGRMTGSYKDVANFFNRPQGYNDFILHYAKICKPFVDAMIIGSEMVELTPIKNESGEYVAVQEFINLASKVRSIVGKDIKLTYAADWSEYHHDEEGDYHLDDLWSSDNIDMIGIDAYFPLTNWSSGKYSVDEIKAGWSSGEGYDFYYDDKSRTRRRPLTNEYAWKNIRWWWENEHFNKNGEKTKWRPKSKKIWFTEYGFPSIDLASNQPNLFMDESSAESGAPHMSNGNIDIAAQRYAIEATEEFWSGSEMLEERFLWCWDARPYPSWPNKRGIWGDSGSWYRGHWVQGKLGCADLGAIISEICLSANISPDIINTSDLKTPIRGLLLDYHYTAKALINLLREVYGFDIFEDDGKIVFKEAGCKKAKVIKSSDLIASIQEEHLPIVYESEVAPQRSLPNSVKFGYMDFDGDLSKISVSEAQARSHEGTEYQLLAPILMTSYEAETASRNIIYRKWAEKVKYSFFLPIAYSHLKISDIITLDNGRMSSAAKITNINVNKNNCLKITATSCLGVETPELSNINLNSQPYNRVENAQISLDKDHVPRYQSSFKVEIIDLGFVTSEPALLIASAGYTDASSKEHTLSVYAQDRREFYHSIMLNNRATIGRTTSQVSHHTDCLIDHENTIKVALRNGSLESIDYEDLFDLEAENIAMLGDEVIKFADVVKCKDKDNVYYLSNLVRGLYGTKASSHKAGERFVLLNSDLQAIPLNKSVSIKPGRLCMRIDCFDRESFSYEAGKETGLEYKAKNLMPMSDMTIDYFLDKEKNMLHLTWYPRDFNDNLLIDSLSDEERLQKMSFKVSFYDERDRELASDNVSGASYSLPFSDKVKKVSICQYRSLDGISFLGEKNELLL